MNRMNRGRGAVAATLFLLFSVYQGCVKDPAVSGPGETGSEERILNLTIDNFDSAVTGDYGLVVIDFFEPGCPACADFAYTFDTLARTLPAEVLMGKVDVTVETGLTNTYDIYWLPTVVFIRNGAEALRVVGKDNNVEYLTGVVDSLLGLP